MRRPKLGHCPAATFERAAALEAEPRRSLLHPLQRLGPQRVDDARRAEAVRAAGATMRRGRIRLGAAPDADAVAEQQLVAALALGILPSTPEASCLGLLRGCRAGRSGRAGGRALPRHRASARRRWLRRVLLEAAPAVEGHQPRRTGELDAAAASLPRQPHRRAHERAAGAAPPPRAVHHDIRQPCRGHDTVGGLLVERQRGTGHEASAGVVCAAKLHDEHELRRNARARQGELRARVV